MEGDVCLQRPVNESAIAEVGNFGRRLVKKANYINDVGTPEKVGQVVGDLAQKIYGYLLARLRESATGISGQTQ